VPTLPEVSTEDLLRAYNSPDTPAAAPPAGDMSSISTQDLLRAYHAPEKPAEVSGQISIPGLGKPSMIGFLKGLYGTAKSGATLPGDVYAGRVDPLSEEGIGRAADLATVTSVGNIPSVARRSATAAPLSAAKIEEAATKTYQDVTEASRATPIAAPPQAVKRDYMAPLTGERLPIAQQVGPTTRDVVNEVRRFADEGGPRAKSAPLVHAEIDSMAKAKDLGDLIDSRRELTRIIREESGPDVAAAGMALKKLDPVLDHFSPGTSKALREADINYAIAKKSADIESKIQKAIDKQRDQTLAGNRIKKTVEPLLEKKGAERMSPEVRAAIERAARPGMAVNMLRPFAAFDPTSRALGPMLSGMAGFAHPAALAAMPVGMGARVAYDRILKNRAAGISPAMRAEAPATLAQPGYSAGGTVGRPSLPPQTSLLQLMAPQRGSDAAARPQFAGPQLPFRQGEQMDNLMASINGPQGYPDFRWVNPAGVDAFLANGPMSTNIEDRRDELGGFDAAAARMRRQGRRP